MNLLFLHQNFPGQYNRIVPYIAQNTANTVVCLGDIANVRTPAVHPTFTVHTYKTPEPAQPGPYPGTTHFEACVRRADTAARKAEELRRSGFVPDVICCHPGWGDGLFLPDVFPEARLLFFFEYYYRPENDVGFDPEFPATAENQRHIRAMNTVNLFSLESAHLGVTPTKWQWATYPKRHQERIAVIHDGIDTELACPKNGVGINIDQTLVLTQSHEVITFANRNLEPIRGFHKFMRALPEIQRRRPKAHVLILGGDKISYGRQPPQGTTWKQFYLNELADKLDLSRIHFLGRIPYEQYLAVLQLSSVHAYLTYPFVLSWSMLEAMSCGCLVVGSRTPPVEEVIRHGHNGLLVDFFKPQEIADAVDEVLNHPNRMQAIRDNARRTIIEQYDLQTICLPRHKQLIENLASR